MDAIITYVGTLVTPIERPRCVLDMRRCVCVVAKRIVCIKVVSIMSVESDNVISLHPSTLMHKDIFRLICLVAGIDSLSSSRSGAPPTPSSMGCYFY